MITAKMTIPRKWYMAIIGLAAWEDRAQDLSVKEFQEVKETIDLFLSKIYRSFRRKGSLVLSLLWSQENLAPAFLLEVSSSNEKFLKEIRAKFNDVTATIINSLSSADRDAALGKNIRKIAPEGKTLFLDCTIPQGNEFFPDDSEIIQAFSDAFNAEFLSIKRSENDFLGRKEWLSGLENVLYRSFLREVGPVKKLKEVKEIEAKRLYDRKTSGDFEKIVRYLRDAVPYRSSHFEVKKTSSTLQPKEPLGHIIVQYLSTTSDMPLKLNWRSTTHERLGRKVEEQEWIFETGINWKELDMLLVVLEELVYEKIEKTVFDVGGIKLDSFWTERDQSNNVFFLSKFDFTEDILKTIKEFVENRRENFEVHIGARTSDLLDIWRRTEITLRSLVFEVRAFDADEEKQLVAWIKALKERETPGPNYNGEYETLQLRNFRPF